MGWTVITDHLPPVLQDLLTDGEHTPAWLWGFDNIIPYQARQDIIDNFLLRRICSENIDKFRWAFQRIIKKKQYRFIKLLQAESFEFDPMITNYVTELTHAGAEETHTGRGTTNTTKTTEGETATNSTAQTTEEGTAGNNTTRTDNLSETTARNAERNTTAATSEEGTKDNTGTQTTTDQTAKTDTKETEHGRTETRTPNTTETTTYNTTEGTSENETQGGRDTKTDDITKTGSETISSGEKTKETVRILGDPNAQGIDAWGTVTEEQGSVLVEHGNNNNIRTSDTTRNGAHDVVRSNSNIVSDMPEVDNAAIIASMQVASAGTPSSPGMTYASSGAFAVQAEKESFTNYGEHSTEEQTGSTWDNTSYGVIAGSSAQDPRRTLVKGHEETTETEEQTTPATKASTEATDGETVTAYGKTTAKTGTGTKTGTEATATTGTETTAEGGTTTEETTTDESRTNTRTDDLAETTTKTAQTTQAEDEEETSTRANTGTVTSTGEETTQKETATTANTTGTTETSETGSTQTEDEKKREEERVAYHVITGRNGYSPQELLLRYQDFILNSRALEWLEGELEPCFYVLHDEEVEAWI